MRATDLRQGDRVVLVDDWIETRSQATAARNLVYRAGAHWVDCVVIVDEASAEVRQSVGPIRGLVESGQLP
jgi:adenine phosphoribosyltransferase